MKALFGRQSGWIKTQKLHILKILDWMAENGGFEPPIELSPYNGLANRRLQPLGQLSVLLAQHDCAVLFVSSCFRLTRL
jgi:hypothetical protein